MKLDFTTITQERKDELQKAVEALFLLLMMDVEEQNMETINVSIAEFCNTPEELAMCAMISGAVLKAYDII